MKSPFLAAAIQMHAGEDRAANLARASTLVDEAADRGARLVVLPEFFNGLGRLEETVAAAEPIPGPSSAAMAALAARHGITLVAGSICEQSDQEGRAYNTSLLFDPQGNPIAKYRKTHLFCVDLPGAVSFDEPRYIIPGDRLALTETPLCRLGQATCYDLRFPELFRRLGEMGMEVLAFPSAFTAQTGRAHWEILLRARAIENQVYVVAANQYGQHGRNLATYGHSMIVDPWGEVLTTAADGDAVLIAELDPERLASVRQHLPALAHRRNL